MTEVDVRVRGIGFAKVSFMTPQREFAVRRSIGLGAICVRLLSMEA